MAAKIVRVPVNPAVLQWARARAGLDAGSLKKDFPKIDEWESGEVQPTLKQLEKFARKVRVPFGFLFLDSPPDEPLPIPDFRTMTGPPRRPSPDLLDTIYVCQQRQEWYRNYLQTAGAEALPFVGEASLEDDPAEVAGEMRRRLRFDLEERKAMFTWTGALSLFIQKAEAAGVLVMSSSIVGNNTRRKLDPQEFRGFALVDKLAPIVFINAADTNSARMFTLAHELAHIWLGKEGISDVGITDFPQMALERWCNQAAAEFLVPRVAFHRSYRPDEDLNTQLKRLAREFKVSTLVILRRIYEIGELDEPEFREIYRTELNRLRRFERSAEKGGNFYNTINVRVSKTFARALITSTLEGRTLFRDAFRLLGISRQKTFDEIAKTLRVA